MVKLLDITGQKFSRLTVLERSANTKYGRVAWKCICECGNYCVVASDSLVRLNTKSCGCLSIEVAPTKHKTHGLTNSTEYIIWSGMKARCDNPNNPSYEFYGMRGISYIEEWKDFNNFLKDMGKRPEGLQLDRIDVNSNYCKENCKWSDTTEQGFNKRLLSSNKSGKTGVHFNKRRGKYIAAISQYGVNKYLGIFDNFEDACKAREKAEIELYGFSKE
jgi:hypothetical protein